MKSFAILLKEVSMKIITVLESIFTFSLVFILLILPFIDITLSGAQLLIEYWGIYLFICLWFCHLGWRLGKW